VSANDVLCTCDKKLTIAHKTLRRIYNRDCPIHGDEPACIGCTFADLNLDNPVVVGRGCPRHDTRVLTPTLSYREPTIDRGQEHELFIREFQRDIAKVANARTAARNAELDKLVIGILSGREGATSATLIHAEDGTVHGIYDGPTVERSPFTITEYLPTYDRRGSTENSPRLVHTIPQRWAMFDDNLGALPISKHAAAWFLEHGHTIGRYEDGLAFLAPKTTDAPAPAQREETPMNDTPSANPQVGGMVGRIDVSTGSISPGMIRADRPNPPIAQVVDHLDNLVEQASNALGRLVTQVAPVLREDDAPKPSTPGDERSAFGDSELARRLSGTAAALESLLRRFDNVSSRVEV
jgi:hypothetical protein